MNNVILLPEFSGHGAGVVVVGAGVVVVGAGVVVVGAGVVVVGAGVDVVVGANVLGGLVLNGASVVGAGVVVVGGGAVVVVVGKVHSGVDHAIVKPGYPSAASEVNVIFSYLFRL